LTLADFLKREGARPWGWGGAGGGTDCSLILADWCIRNGHQDPAEGLRGAYGTELECARLVKRAGGLLQLLTERFAAIGLEVVDTPAPGVIGCIGIGGWRQWGGIFDGEHWAVRLREGIVGVTAAPLKMWAV
jgi:hypothetical protein